MRGWGPCEKVRPVLTTYPKGGNVKKLTLLVTMLMLVLGIGVSALAQEVPEETATEDTATEETTTEETATEDTATEETTTEETATEDTATEETATEETTTEEATPASTFTLGADGLSVDRTDGATTTNIPCFAAFREEQEELVTTGVYPTSISEAVRACEDFGIANPYPAPYFYDTDGFLYTYDPIEGIYSAPDPDNGVVYVYDPTSGTFSTYDPATGAYL